MYPGRPLVAVAAGHTARTALRFENQDLSYAELEEAIASAASAITDLGIGVGDAFAMLCENRPEVMIAYFAAARVGAVFVPINPSLSPSEITYVIEHSDAVMLFHDEAMREVAEQAAPHEMLRDIGRLSARGHPFAALSTDASRDFLIIYTSGSTGRPKAVVFDQAAEHFGNAALIDLWAICPDDRMVVALPLGFLYGLSTAAATGLQAGCEVTIVRKFSPARTIAALVAQRATIFHGVPTMFAMMVDYVERENLAVDLSFMRLLICAGAPLPPSLRLRFAERFGKAIDDYYALTEVRPIFGRFADDKTTWPPETLGRLAPGADVRICDAAGDDVAEGLIGEIFVKAASTMVRYHKNPDLTASVKHDGFFATGDLGLRNSAGFYYLTGRIKDVIIRGGANIAPAEVENVLLELEPVSGAAVLGDSDRIYGEVPVAFITLRERLATDVILDHCRRRLADFKVPVRVEVLQELPLGVTGKVDKNALRHRMGIRG